MFYLLHPLRVCDELQPWDAPPYIPPPARAGAPLDLSHAYDYVL